MPDEFEIAIGALYDAFAAYPPSSNMEGCPCCVSDADRSALHSKELRTLDDADLSKYTFKAMTTWGNTADFKHYLPRILELTAKQQLAVDIFVVLGKLSYGHWQDWPAHEQQSLLFFLKAWWTHDINRRSHFDPELLIEAHKILQDLTGMLEAWDLRLASNGFRNYVTLIESYYHEIRVPSPAFQTLGQSALKVLSDWISQHSNKLEEAFFIYEETDKEFSERLSTALHVYEQLQQGE